MKNEEDVVKLLRKQVTTEKNVARFVEESAKNIENVAIRELLNSIALDSRKHAKVVEVAIRLVTGQKPLLDEKEIEKIRKIIQRHIRMETEAIRAYADMANRFPENKDLQLLFQYLWSDEQRHHAILTHIIETISREETPTEEAVWSLFWKYSRLAELSVEQLKKESKEIKAPFRDP
ncbi:MAG: ferritin family protein [Candidatus Heimdallarchaeota archaeon]